MIDTLWEPQITAAQILSFGESIAQQAARDAHSVRIAVAGSRTTSFLARAIACAVFREGDVPRVEEALHGAYVQEILDPRSGMHAFEPDVVVLAADWSDLVADLPPNAGRDEAARAIDQTVARFIALWDVLRTRNVRIMQHIPAPPAERLRGVADRFAACSARTQLEAVMRRLYDAGGGDVTWIDVASLAEETGLSRWMPPRLAFNGAMPFDPTHLPAYMRLFGGAWRYQSGRDKKALVLDLDGTLWGGVIGDDGLGGIVLGPGTARGEAFASFARYVRALRARGVILAVCSKNDAATARSAFEHPHAVLSLADFAAFECSWDDKASGLRRVASSLGLGLDAIVFADDNPAECDLVRRELPMVATVTLGDDPATFVAAIESDRWFDSNRLTGADAIRAQSYAARTAVETARAAATDIPAFLQDLHMKGRLFTPADDDLARVTQLEARTNQFNLTARRYDERAIRDFAKRDDRMLLACELSDRYGDHGVVSSAIGVVEDDVLRIDSWVMSCRVFSRTLEEYMIAEVTRRARERGVRRVRGEYVPSEKNRIVSGLFERLGFAPIAAHIWEADLTSYTPPKTYISHAG